MELEAENGGYRQRDPENAEFEPSIATYEQPKDSNIESVLGHSDDDEDENPLEVAQAFVAKEL